MSLDYLCRLQVQVSVSCAWRIPAHLRCTQCSILLHLMDICFLTCICLWQISQIQTFLFRVVGPGLVSTSPAFVTSSGSAWRVCPKNGKSGPHCWGRGGPTQFAQQLQSAVTLLLLLVSFFLCFGCGGVSGVGVEWVWGLDKGWERWGGVMSV